MGISKATLDEINERIDILDIAREGNIQIKGTSDARKANCTMNPSMHKDGDKTPSMSFHKSGNFCKCFGCDYSAKPLKFYMDITGAPFLDAVKELAQRANITIEYDGAAPVKNVKSEELRKALSTAQDYYQKQLAISSKAQDYLSSRGFSASDLREMKAGFVPRDYGKGLISALSAAGISNDIAISAGLLKINDKGRLTPMIGGERVMFGIEDGSGKLVSFAGRVLGDQKPKYINGPDTEIFTKGKTLFGLKEARPAAKKENGQIFAFEGYMDVLSLRSKGLSNSVGAMGTALSRGLIERLQKENKEVIFCFDGDPAGRAAADRSLANALPVLTGSAKFKFLLLPKGHDPDSYASEHGVDAFKELSRNAYSLTQYFAKSLTEMIGSDPEDVVQVVEKAGKLLTTMTPGLFQKQLIKSLSSTLDIDPSDITTHIGLTNEKNAGSVSVSNNTLPLEGGYDAAIRRTRSRVRPSKDLAEAQASTQTYLTAAVERKVERPKSLPVRNATPEALFANTHKEAMRQLLNKPNIGANDFVTFLQQVTTKEAALWHGRIDVDKYRGRIEGVMRRYIEPRMHDLGVDPNVAEVLRAKLHSPRFATAVQEHNNRVLSSYQSFDPSVDGAVMYKSVKKTEGVVPRMQQAASSGPNR